MFRLEPRLVQENGQENTYANYLAMEDLLDKLKLLNYDIEFVKELKMKPLNRHYFAIQNNPGEQFYLFTSLGAWLIRKLGKSFEQPQEYDDPNSTIAAILNHVRELGIVVDFPPNKLKQGAGEHALYILGSLTDEVMKITNFKWIQPLPPEEKEPDIEAIDDESELILDRVEEEMLGAYSDESDDDNLFHVDDLAANKSKPIKSEDNFRLRDVSNNIDQESWRLELERVLPKLKVTIKSDSRDWQSHYEQMKTYKENIEKVMPGVKVQLEKMHNDITVTLEKINNREKHLNRDLEPLLDQYRTLQDELSKLKDKYKSISGGVTERTRELAKLSDQLETIKQQTEEKGSSVSDGTPLVNIRKGMSKIKTEITEMDVRIGVLDNVLLQSRLRDVKMIEEDLANPLSTY